MPFSKTALAVLIALVAVLIAPVAALADEEFPTTDASAVVVARSATLVPNVGAVVDIAVVCPVAGTVDGLFLTFEQHRHGQVTVGYTDYESVAIPCSPEGSHVQLNLEVFTDIYFGPGRAVVTEAIVCGLNGCRSLDIHAAIILHRG
jgi:hypothetical protein